MPVFALQIKATLDNVSSISPRPNNRWKIDVRNPTNDYEVRSGVTLCADDEYEVDNERVKGLHFAMRWEGASANSSTIKILPPDAKELKPAKKGGQGSAATDVKESGVWTNVLVLECRNLEPVGYTVGIDDFIVTSEGGTVWDKDVNIAGDEFSEFCEKSDAPVGISELEFRWVTV